MRHFFVAVSVALTLGLAGQAIAQVLTPIAGSEFYCLEFEDGATFLGQRSGDQIETIDFGSGKDRQRKRVLKAKARLKAMSKLLRNKELSRKDRKALTNKIAQLASSSTKGKVFLTTLKNNIRKERSLKRLYQNQLDQIVACEEGKLESVGNIEKKLFVESLVHPITGQEIVFSGVYIATKFPKKVKKKQTTLEFDFCTQYSSPDDRVNAVGARVPSEGKVTFTNNLCGQARAPVGVRGIDCSDLLPPKTVGILLTGNVSENGPSLNTLAFFEETTGTVAHYVRKIPKKGCQS